MADEITEKDYLQQIILDQLRRHSSFQVDDLYKMVYQVTCGGEHLIKAGAKAKKELQEEWKNLEKVQKREPLLEVIDPRGDVLRVNLRVYKKIGGTLQRMFDVFVRSARAFKKDLKCLVRYWEEIMEMAEKGEIPFSRDALEDFYIGMGRKGFPPIHHSESYVEANRPAYRVVLKKLWDGFEEVGKGESDEQSS